MPGECRVVEGDVRFRGASRHGSAPREPSRPASRAGSADAQAQIPGGADLGEDDKREAEAAEAAAAEAKYPDAEETGIEDADAGEAAAEAAAEEDSDERPLTTLAPFSFPATLEPATPRAR